MSWTLMTSDWMYNGTIFTSENIQDNYGFVYLITDLTNNKKYIGKKFFWNKKTLSPLKGKKNKRNKIVESDWQNYFGSNEEIKQIVEQVGRERFHREILVLCKSKGECSYIEAKIQFEQQVLLKDDFYNSFIGVKLHRNHVKTLRDDYDRKS
jgi:hypothetical protein